MATRKEPSATSERVVDLTQQHSTPHELAGRWLAPGAVAVSLVGFWLYLALLAIIGLRPHTSLTGVYYVLLGVVLWPLAWRRRRTVFARLAAGRLTRIYAGATTLLFLWFVLDAVVRVHGSFAERLAAQLVLWTAPTALLVFGMSRAELERALAAIVAVSCTFALLEVAMTWRGSVGGRYSPLTHLDPISASQYAAVGLVALLALQPSRRRLPLYVAAVVLLVFGALLPGSRGPVAGAALAALVMLAFRRTSAELRLALAAVVIAAGAGGYAAAHAIGTSSHLTFAVFHSAKPTVHHAGHVPPPVSSDAIRRELLTHALRSARQRPLTGNGVGTLSDESAVAREIGMNGCCTYPHNEPVEAVYSLGVGGLLLYAIAIGGAAVALFRLLRRRKASLSIVAVFALGFAVYAFVQSELSGEIAEDVWIWAAASLAFAAREP